MAEGARFELAIPFGICAFQAHALGHYATPPFINSNVRIFETRNGLIELIHPYTVHNLDPYFKGNQPVTRKDKIGQNVTI